MPSNYTGVASHVSPTTSPVVAIPIDGDPDNAATFSGGMQKLTDFVALLGPGRSIGQLSFLWTSAQSGTFGTSIVLATATPSAGVTIGPDCAVDTTNKKITVNSTGIYRIGFYGSMTNSGTAATHLVLSKNGNLTNPVASLGFIPASGATIAAEVYLSLTAADFVQLGLFTTSGTGTYNVTSFSAFASPTVVLTVERVG